MATSLPPGSPEEAERARLWDRTLSSLRPGARVYEVAKRTILGTLTDGSIHAGNLAYLALISLFPFFIVTAALAHVMGRGPDTAVAIESFLRTLPLSLRQILRPAINDVLAQRTGSLLWIGAAIGLWTTGSFIETIRDILRRAYRVPYNHPFWRYRIASGALILGSVLLTFVAFSVQLVMTGVEQVVQRLFPFATGVLTWIGWSRLAPALALWFALYVLFFTLTPGEFRRRGCPKWPGAAFTAFWWVSVTMALPKAIALLGGYGRTYGSLAGAIVVLIFFWLVGFGLVIGAHLNAALAERPESEVRGAAETVTEE